MGAYAKIPKYTKAGTKKRYRTQFALISFRFFDGQYILPRIVASSFKSPPCFRCVSGSGDPGHPHRLPTHFHPKGLQQQFFLKVPETRMIPEII